MWETEKDGRALFEARFSQLEGTIEILARRKRLDRDARQDFYGQVMLKVVEDDYAMLRRFEGRSSWRTYLTLVVQRVLLDQRDMALGRWRPCAEARRLGPLAIEIDQRINRDGWSEHETLRWLSCCDASLSVQTLAAVAARIPRRTRRSLVGDVESMPIAAEGVRADARVRARSARRARRRLRRALVSALRLMSVEERRLLDLRFVRGWTVRRIAAHCRLPVRPLYRQFARLLRRLRRRLLSAGLDWSTIAPVLESGGLGARASDALSAQPPSCAHGVVEVTRRDATARASEATVLGTRAFEGESFAAGNVESGMR